MKQKCLTGGKMGKFVYLATNPLKGTLNFVISARYGSIYSQYSYQLHVPTVRMHRLVCIFVISRFPTTFSHEMTVVSEIYCQNLKDKKIKIF